MNLKNIMLLATVSACWAQYDGSYESTHWFDHLDVANQLLVTSYIDELNKNGFYSSETKKTNKTRKKLELSSLFVAFDTDDLKCKVRTCENIKAKWRTVCYPHKNAEKKYKENPSIKNKKLYDELLEYQESEKQKKSEEKAAGPVCKNKECGETDEKKFAYNKKKKIYLSFCNRCRVVKYNVCKEHSTPEQRCYKDSCMACKLAGKKQKKMCDEDDCDITIYRKHAIYGFTCSRCFARKNPEHKYVKRRQEKEHAFYEVYKSILPDITIYPNFCVHVTLPNGQPGRRFVDLRIQTPSLIIDTELDEHQHKHISYDTPLQRMRSDLIYQASQSSGKQYILLRFNPDAFTAKNGDRFRSCFTQKPGARADISDKVQWDMRISYFKSRLEECMQLDPNKLEIFPHVEHMFFDGFDTSTLTFDAKSHVRKRKRVDE